MKTTDITFFSCLDISCATYSRKWGWRNLKNLATTTNLSVFASVIKKLIMRILIALTSKFIISTQNIITNPWEKNQLLINIAVFPIKNNPYQTPKLFCKNNITLILNDAETTHTIAIRQIKIEKDKNGPAAMQ